MGASAPNSIPATQTVFAKSISGGPAHSAASVRSPDVGHQPPGTGLVRPVCVAEMVDKHPLLRTDAVRVDQQEGERRRAGHKPIDGQSAAHPNENRADVTGMADESVRATLDDDLSVPSSQGAGVILTENAHCPDVKSEADDTDSYSDPRQHRVGDCRTDTRGG